MVNTNIKTGVVGASILILVLSVARIANSRLAPQPGERFFAIWRVLLQYGPEMVLILLLGVVIVLLRDEGPISS
ncbi:MAG: hypothetical protein J07HQW2_00715 [Haloquadratum walsbyi J07HQW2]|uniref:Uncharacterized protein n=1 Tax=Haloquadratum walsbyi J07HQW2 TaxID=1238425 RepID=U1PPN8_9EURY|nr:MAG: hypothetical protein J07HQW2_00715 [Haloquadratum walsbyi J07HQW2]